MFLTERVAQKAQILESDKSKLPTGVLCRILYPICNIGKRNNNRRIYSESVWERVHTDMDIKEKLQTRTLYGLAEHPKEEITTNLEKTSHIVTRLFMNEQEGREYAEIDVLDTPYGRIIDTLLRADCQVGVSTRAEGELRESEDAEGPYLEVVPESYRFITVDFTADPSTHGAYPVKVERNLVGQIRQGLEAKKIDRRFAMTMLETCTSREAVALVESIQKDIEEQSEQEKKDELILQYKNLLTQAEVGTFGPVEIELRRQVVRKLEDLGVDTDLVEDEWERENPELFENSTCVTCNGKLDQKVRKGVCKECQSGDIVEGVVTINEPPAALAALADKAGKSQDTAEKYWDMAKKSAKEKFGNKKDADYWAYVMGITKRRLGISGTKESTEASESCASATSLLEQFQIGEIDSFFLVLQNPKGKDLQWEDIVPIKLNLRKLSNLIRGYFGGTDDFIAQSPVLTDSKDEAYKMARDVAEELGITPGEEVHEMVEEGSTDLSKPQEIFVNTINQWIEDTVTDQKEIADREGWEYDEAHDRRLWNSILMYTFHDKNSVSVDGDLYDILAYGQADYGVGKDLHQQIHDNLKQAGYYLEAETGSDYVFVDEGTQESCTEGSGKTVLVTGDRGVGLYKVKIIGDYKGSDQMSSEKIYTAEVVSTEEGDQIEPGSLVHVVKGAYDYKEGTFGGIDPLVGVKERSTDARKRALEMIKNKMKSTPSGYDEQALREELTSMNGFAMSKKDAESVITDAAVQLEMGRMPQFEATTVKESFEITDDVLNQVTKELDVDGLDMDQLRRGIEVEQEHADITNDDPLMTAKIAIAHLREIPDYYTRLDAMEAEAKNKVSQDSGSEKSEDVRESVSATAKALTRQKITMAERNAELQKLEELYVEVSERCDRILGNAAGDITNLSTQNADLVNKISVMERQYATSLSELQAESVRGIEEATASLKKELVAKTNEIAQLTERVKTKLTEARERADSHTAAVRDLKESHQKEIKTLTESFEARLQSELVRKYVACQLDFSGLTLPSNARALLEKCKTETEVDDMLERFRVAISESALHSSEGLSGATVPTGTEVSEEVVKVHDSVGAAMSGMGVR